MQFYQSNWPPDFSWGPRAMKSHTCSSGKTFKSPFKAQLQKTLRNKGELQTKWEVMWNRSVVNDLLDQKNCSFSLYISSKWETYSVISHLLDGSSSSLGVSDQKPFNMVIGCRPGHMEGVVGLVKGHQVWGWLQFTSCKFREKSSNMIWHVKVFHALNSGATNLKVESLVQSLLQQTDRMTVLSTNQTFKSRKTQAQVTPDAIWFCSSGSQSLQNRSDHHTWTLDTVTQVVGDIVNDVHQKLEVIDVVHVDLIRVRGDGPQLILISILYTWKRDAKLTPLYRRFPKNTTVSVVCWETQSDSPMAYSSMPLSLRFWELKTTSSWDFPSVIRTPILRALGRIPTLVLKLFWRR